MIIGITGKSGSGKSTFAKTLAGKYKDFIYLDVDSIGHSTHNDETVKLNLLNTFGNEIFTDGEVNRKALGKIVFANKDEMAKLTAITWEYMERKIDKFLLDNQDKSIVLDWALLPKTKYFKNVDLNILVTANYEERLRRTIARDNITKEEFELRETASMDYENYKSDLIINTDKNENIERLVEDIYDKSIIHR